jgi:Ubiquitin-like autophagy protein Apg12
LTRSRTRTDSAKSPPIRSPDFVDMADPIPDESPSSIPPNLSSSIILSALPRDATTALSQASLPSKTKRTPPCQTNLVTVRFKAVGRAPILVDAKQRGQIGSDQKFGTLANHLRRQLKLKASESLVIPPWHVLMSFYM